MPRLGVALALSGVLLSWCVSAAVGLGGVRAWGLEGPSQSPQAHKAPSPHAPPRRGPDGFGTAKFGMTVDQVRQRYAALAPAPGLTSAAYFRSPHLARYVLTNVDVPGLKGACTVELRFWKDHLWSVIINYTAAAAAQAVPQLTHQYGAPTSKAGDPTWVLDKTTIVTAPSQLWYSFNDNAISQDAQRALIEAIQAQRTRPTPPAPVPTGQPAAAPPTPAALH